MNTPEAFDGCEQPHRLQLDDPLKEAPVPTVSPLSPGTGAPSEAVGPPEGGTPTSGDGWLRGASIAAALELTKKTVHTRAQAEGWPTRRLGNRYEYQPPVEIATLCLDKESADHGPRATDHRLQRAITVRFPDLAHSARARETVLLREQAVLAVRVLSGDSVGEAPTGAPEAGALPRNLGAVRAQVVADFTCCYGISFSISIRSLERWEKLYDQFGLDGLVDQKRGVVGRPAHAEALAPETVLKGQALALDHGIKGRVNVARGHRQLAADMTLSAGERAVLHGAHPSKSYVAPSIRDALHTDPFTAGLIHIGTKHARLNSRWTPCDHSQVKAGQVITADDMTANCYIWAEWPNERGWIVVRPQVLAVLDIGSLSWTNLRLVLRASGQYTRDDVWGVTGDFFDAFGLPKMILFEGGIWRSNVVAGHKIDVGHKTGLSDESRYGGLKSLGIQLLHSRLPRSKPIEGAFNQLQYASDAVKGYSGREEMKDRPEHLNKQMDYCRQGKAHPKEFFLNASEYMEHLYNIKRELNDERQDGEILRGRSPAEKWAEDAPVLKQFPDSAKWLYRSAYNIETVSRNGIRVTQRTGKYKETHYFDNPQLLTPLIGRRVAIYWNDHQPDTDAIVVSLRGGKPCDFMGIAKAVKRLGRFSATPEELKGESQRKAAAMRYAVSLSRDLAPHLQRQPANLVRVDAATEQVGEQITQARDRADASEAEAREVRRGIAAVQVTREDLGAALDDVPTVQRADLSAAEIADIFEPDQPE